jgi:hypothetical protein
MSTPSSRVSRKSAALDMHYSEADPEPASVSFDNDAVNTLESNEHVKSVEVDGEVKTQ